MAHQARLAELDRRFSVERDLLERMLFKLVVIRSMRLVSADASDLIEAHRQFEEAAAGIRQPGSRENERDELPEGLEMLAEMAPEPYRTMFADHLERFTEIAMELGDPSVPRTSGDPFDRRLEVVLCRAVRGAVCGSTAPELRSFVRSGMREQPTHGA